MKRKLAIILCGLMVVSMSACGKATPSEAVSVSRKMDTDETAPDALSDDVQATDGLQEDADTSIPGKEGEFGYPVEPLDSFFSNYNDTPDAGYAIQLNTGAGKLSVAYNSVKKLFAWFDADGSVFYESPNYPGSEFVGGRCAARTTSDTTNQRCYIVTKVHEFLDLTTPAGITDGDGTDIIHYGEDSTGYTLWTVKKEDLVTGTSLTLTAWDNDGNIKLQTSTDNEPFDISGINECYEGLMGRNKMERPDLYDELYYVGGAYYRFNASTSSGHEAYYYLNVEDGSVTASGESSLKFYNGQLGTVEYSNGLAYLHDKDGVTGYYDADGNCVIDLSAYDIREAHPFQPEGTAIVEMKNPDGVQFFGLLGKDGSWVLEPQKAQCVTATNGFFLVRTDTDLVLYDYTGAVRNDLFTEGAITDIGTFDMSEKDENGVRVGVVTFKAGDNCVGENQFVRIENDTSYTYLGSCIETY